MVQPLKGFDSVGGAVALMWFSIQVRLLPVDLGAELIVDGSWVRIERVVRKRIDVGDPSSPDDPLDRRLVQ